MHGILLSSVACMHARVLALMCISYIIHCALLTGPYGAVIPVRTVKAILTLGKAVRGIFVHVMQIHFLECDELLSMEASLLARDQSD